MIRLGMKKILALVTSLGSLVNPINVFAQATSPILLQPPGNVGVPPTTSLNDIFTRILTIVFTVAAVLVLIYLIWGAFQWITSGGDKEAVGKARSRIIHALVGLAILALAFLIIKVVGNIIGFDITAGLPLPTLSGQPPGTLPR